MSETAEQPIPQPAITDPNRTVEAVYTMPDADPAQTTLDYPTRAGMEAFLQERIDHTDKPLRPGHWERVPKVPREVTVFRPDGWRLRSREAAKRILVGTALATVALNAISNLDNLAHLGRDAKHAVGSAFDWTKRHLPGNNQTGSDTAAPTNSIPLGPDTPPRLHTQHRSVFVHPAEVNGSTPNATDIRTAAAVVQVIIKHGGENIEVAGTGHVSDEWTSKADLGLAHPDPAENGELAKKLTTNTDAALKSALGKDASHVNFAEGEQNEHVRTPAELQHFEQILAGHGITGTKQIRAAFATFNHHPDALPANVRAEFQKLFGNQNRGDGLDITYTVREEREKPPMPAKTDHGKPPADSQTPTTAQEHEDGYDWHGNPWGLVGLLGLTPYPAFRREVITRMRQRLVRVPGDLSDPEHLLLYPNAIKPVETPEGQSPPDKTTRTNKLVDNAWAYARKYQNLFREPERLRGTYRYDYTDPQGNEKSLRALFVDHEPTVDAIDMFKKLFEQGSLMHGGKLADDLSMVVVYPEKNAGRHGNAKKVGLGLDTQYKDTILGVAIPSIGLIEMQMDPNPTAETELEAQKLLARYFGAMWTGAHELGHFGDLNNNKNELTVVSPGKVPVYALPNRFADTAAAEYDRIQAEQAANKPVTWRIRRTVVNAKGEPTIIDDVVETGDPRLTEAQFIRKESSWVDPYAGTGPAELFAQGQARMATGTGVPLNQEPDVRKHDVTPRPGFADSYAESTSLHGLIAEHLGADPNADNLVFAGEPNGRDHYGPVTSDPLLQQLLIEARKTPLPAHDELLHVITGKRI